MIKPRCKQALPCAGAAFRKALVAWFDRHGKDYPWRRTRDPYEVLVSEVMLQQTQVATVLGKGYYTRFLEAFPDVQRLAAAADAPLLKAWEGLGYYRRARMLRETARAVVAHHGGVFPSDADLLQSLPGLGRYTAGALRAFAFQLPAVLVDGNVARVLARLMDFHGQVDSVAGSRQVWAWAEELADAKRPSAYHAALMELGQTLCRPKSTACLECPVSAFCATRDPLALPLKKSRVSITELDEHALWLRDRRGRVLLHHEQGKQRTGLWKLPLREPAQMAGLPVISESRYGITRYRVTLKVHDGSRMKPRPVLDDGDCWVAKDEISGLAMAAPFRKVVEQLLEDC